MTEVILHTYSLPEVAAMVLPANWKEPVRWLQRHLVNGDISGYKVGHDWRMTADDVTDLVARRRNITKTVTPEAEPVTSETPVSILDGLSARSRRRVKSA
ncbi:hypothetical protein [Mycobacteroides abscessus]|uniref:hypothetical protein n=1 Tax=Mycobacteroides abscessus TaxID=36809 RepID=UPI00078EC31C|nr:hypothetical protein [Mycobacteroides abscessus]AMU20837.1 hypothetical protein A3N95_08480 [Mycobacteroides abscessus]